MHLCSCAPTSDNPKSLEKLVDAAREIKPDLLLEAPDNPKHHAKLVAAVLDISAAKQGMCARRECRNPCVANPVIQQEVVQVVRRSNAAFLANAQNKGTDCAPK